jgi:hypothetical protein
VQIGLTGAVFLGLELPYEGAHFAASSRS